MSFEGGIFYYINRDKNYLKSFNPTTKEITAQMPVPEDVSHITTFRGDRDDVKPSKITTD